MNVNQDHAVDFATFNAGGSREDDPLCHEPKVEHPPQMMPRPAQFEHEEDMAYFVRLNQVQERV